MRRAWGALPASGRLTREVANARNAGRQGVLGANHSIGEAMEGAYLRISYTSPPASMRWVGGGERPAGVGLDGAVRIQDALRKP